MRGPPACNQDTEDGSRARRHPNSPCVQCVKVEASAERGKQNEEQNTTTPQTQGPTLPHPTPRQTPALAARQHKPHLRKTSQKLLRQAAAKCKPQESTEGLHLERRPTSCWATQAPAGSNRTMHPFAHKSAGVETPGVAQRGAPAARTDGEWGLGMHREGRVTDPQVHTARGTPRPSTATGTLPAAPLQLGWHAGAGAEG